MPKKQLMKSVFIAACMFFNLATAEIVSETNCYVGFDGKNRQVRIAFKTYADTELNRNVGALVQHENSMRTIPLVYFGDTSTDEEPNNYELHWLEIIAREISGEYVYARQEAGSGISAYSLTYRNFKNGKEMIFSPSAEFGSSCTIKTRK